MVRSSALRVSAIFFVLATGALGTGCAANQGNVARIDTPFSTRELSAPSTRMVPSVVAPSSGPLASNAAQ
jgi:hypothetical protein